MVLDLFTETQTRYFTSLIEDGRKSTQRKGYLQRERGPLLNRHFLHVRLQVSTTRISYYSPCVYLSCPRIIWYVRRRLLTGTNDFNPVVTKQNKKKNFWDTYTTRIERGLKQRFNVGVKDFHVCSYSGGKKISYKVYELWVFIHLEKRYNSNVSKIHILNSNYISFL